MAVFEKVQEIIVELGKRCIRSNIDLLYLDRFIGLK